MAFESPPTEGQLFTALQNAHGAGDSDGATRIAGMIQSNRDTYAQAHPYLSKISEIAQSLRKATALPEAVTTAANNATDMATFGASKYLGALVGSAVTGQKYTDALKTWETADTTENEASPTAALVGKGAGLALGAGVINAAGKGIKALGVTDAINPLVFADKASKTANVAKMAGTGGVISGAQAIGEGKDTEGVIDNTLTGTAAGAVLGPLAGKLGEVAAPYITKAAGLVSEKLSALIPAKLSSMGKAMLPASAGDAAMLQSIKDRFDTDAVRTLAKKVKLDPEQLAQAAATIKAETGQDVAMKDLLSLAQSGELQKLAARAPVLQNLITKAQEIEAKAAPETLRDTVRNIAGGKPPTVEEIFKGRSANMTAAMDAQDAAGVALRDRQVRLTPDDLEFISSKRGYFGLNNMAKRDPNYALAGRLQNAEDALESGGIPTLPVGDLDALRHIARTLQGSFAAKGERMAANQSKEVAESISEFVGSQHPEYRAANAAYRAESDRLAGYKVGAQNKSRGDIDPRTVSNDLRSAGGTRGYREGLLHHIHASAETPEAGITVARKLANDSGLRENLGEVLTPNEANSLYAHAEHITQTTRRTNAINPPSTSEGGANTANVAHDIAGFAAGVSHGSPWTIHYVANLVRNAVGRKMPDAVQERVAQYLMDPKMLKQGLAIMRRAGASEKEIGNIARQFGATRAAPYVAE